MAYRIGDEEIEIEATLVGPVTAKAWLICESMSGNEIWLPKSVGRIEREADADGNILFVVPQWWAKKNGLT